VGSDEEENNDLVVASKKFTYSRTTPLMMRMITKGSSPPPPPSPDFSVVFETVVPSVVGFGVFGVAMRASLLSSGYLSVS
jgi:hypothetical protein